jgi:hypothetical protein
MGCGGEAARVQDQASAEWLEESSYDGSFTGRTAHYHIVLDCSATTVQCSRDKDGCHRAAHL